MLENETPRRIIFGTRSSALARWQTQWVIAHLQAANPGLVCDTRLFTTTGDRNLDTPLAAFGGKGVFTSELEDALLTGAIDAAVHSLKDLPVEDAPDLMLGAICEREDARDALVSRDGHTLATLPWGARVGTCSHRRTAQMLAARHDLTIMPVRGNVDTRIRKAMNGDYDAIVLAVAGLRRLELENYISDYLPFEVMLPAPGQAALAVQCRVNDNEMHNVLSTIDHTATRAAVTAERTFLLAMGGGCSAPVAAYATVGKTGLFLTGLVSSLDGRQVVRVRGEGDNPTLLATDLAEEALTSGAQALLPT